MQRPLRVLAASLALAAFFVVATLSSPAQAGSATNPEVTDAPNDQSGPAAVPGCVPTANVCPTEADDIISAWIDNETATSLQFHIGVSTPPASTGFEIDYTFAVTTAGTTYTASVNVACALPAPSTPCNSAVTPGGIAAAAAIEATGVVMTVNKTSLGSPAGGAILANITATATAKVAGAQAYGSDSATGPTTYTTLGGVNATNPNDTDGDGLNDTWEQKYFGGTTAQNATGDPDGDGCTNACEQAHGTDPTKKDTDGDGCSDGDEVKGHSDPKDPNSHPAGCGGTTTSSSSSTSATTTSSSTTSHSTSSTTTESTTEGSANYGEYLAGAFGDEGHFFLLITCALVAVVIVLSLIGRGGRWGL